MYTHNIALHNIAYMLQYSDEWILPAVAVRCPSSPSSWRKRETLLRAASANGPCPQLRRETGGFLRENGGDFTNEHEDVAQEKWIRPVSTEI